MNVIQTNEAESYLFAIANRQAGYFTAMQAREAGYSYPNQSYHRKQGHWLDEGWGIYRLKNYPEAEHEQFVKLSLWSRNKVGEHQAVVSHETALSFYDLSDVMPTKIHLSVPKSFRKDVPKNVVLHKAELVETDINYQTGFAVTTPLKTLLDVAASNLSPEHLEQATVEALEQGWVRKSNLKTAISKAPSDIQERFRFLDGL